MSDGTDRLDEASLEGALIMKYANILWLLAVAMVLGCHPDWPPPIGVGGGGAGAGGDGGVGGIHEEVGGGGGIGGGAVYYCATDADCDDKDPCTSEHCSESGICGYTTACGACTSDVDCNDGIRCTLDHCVDHVCAHGANPRCDGDGCHPLACATDWCGEHSDGCDGVLQCKATCGDLSWNMCADWGTCQCTLASELPGASDHESDCYAEWRSHVYVCGRDRDPVTQKLYQLPSSCHLLSGGYTYNGYPLYCCS